jgi:hypothetical protein
MKNELSPSEATLLNAVLSRLSNRTDFDAFVPHEADRQAVYNLVCLLEREDVAQFDPDYDDRLAEAREQVFPKS